nr:G protein-coupled receptor [Proales similis]
MKLKRGLILILTLIEAICRAEASVQCSSDSNRLYSQCYIIMKCPQIEAGRESQLEIQHKNKNTQECCDNSEVDFSFNFPFMFDTNLRDSVNYSSIYASYPANCVKNKKTISANYYAINAIDIRYKVEALGSNIIQIKIRYGLFQLVDGKRPVECSKDLNVSTFRSDNEFDLVINIGIKYTQDTCDQLFNQANLNHFTMTELVDSMIKRNIFAFEEARAIKDLNSSIKYLDLYGYGIRLDRQTFPSRVFGKTTQILIEGVVEKFQSEIFNSSSLRKLDFYITSLRRFLHNNVDWLDLANHRLTDKPLKVFLNGAKGKPNPANIRDGIINRLRSQYDNLYQLDPEDHLFDDNASFCIFYRVKELNLNVQLKGLIFERQGQHSCGCTLFWLWKSFLRNQFDFFYYQDLIECERRSNELERECDLEKMASNCHLKTVQPITDENGYTFIWKLKIAEFILNTVTASAVNCLAVLLNVHVVIVFRRMMSSSEFRKKKLTDKNQPMWSYIYYNTYFVLLQALVFAMEPLTACIEYKGIYCSPLMLTRFAQAFYLFVQSLAGNSLKLMANVTNSLFVLYRFGVNTDSLARLRSSRPLKVVLCCIPAALALSTIILFMNERFDLSVFEDDLLDYLLRDKFKNRRPSTVLQVFYLINMLLGNMVFTLFNLAIDIRLLCFLRSFQAERRKEGVEKRVTKMIVLNGLFAFLFRMPEIAVSISYVVFTFEPLLFPECSLNWEPNHSACPSLMKISRFFYSFTFFENYILLMLFNPDFKKQSKDLWSKS